MQEAILNVSARLFNRDGLKGATFAEIARSLGLLTHSVNNYYQRKEEPR
jgi:AcrR family transcriptional regulator